MIGFYSAFFARMRETKYDIIQSIFVWFGGVSCPKLAMY